MPIRRSEALQPLSRQHHNGLLFCLLIKKGLARNANTGVMAAFVAWFWNKDLQHHFELEEQHLLPLQSHYPSLTAPLQRMMAEHQRLAQLIAAVNHGVSSYLLEELRTTLEAHIRFEERELFPLIESVISAAARTEIGDALAAETDDNCMNYPEKFWE